MLASHALMLLGVPLPRVLAHIRRTRESRYALFKGFFHGATDEHEDAAHPQPRLHSVSITSGAAAIGKTLRQLNLARYEVVVQAIRGQGQRAKEPDPDVCIEAGDVLVLLGSEHGCAAAEIKLVRG